MASCTEQTFKGNAEPMAIHSFANTGSRPVNVTGSKLNSNAAAILQQFSVGMQTRMVPVDAP